MRARVHGRLATDRRLRLAVVPKDGVSPLPGSSTREMDDDVGGDLDCLGKDPRDRAVRLLSLRLGQLEIGRDRRQVADVVRSARRQAPFDDGLLNVEEERRLLQLRARPLHFLIRISPVGRWNRVAFQERRPLRTHRLRNSWVNRLNLATE